MRPVSAYTVDRPAQRSCSAFPSFGSPLSGLHHRRKSVRQFGPPVRARVLFPLLLAFCVVLLPAQASRGASVTVPDVSVFYYPWYATPARDGAWVHWTRPDTSSYAS